MSQGGHIMSSFRKYVQAIVALIVMLGLLFGISLFFPIPHVTDFVQNHILTNMNLSIAVAVVLGVAGVYFVAAFFYALFARSKNKTMRLSNDKGDIVVESETVETYAHDAIHDIKEAQNKQVKAKLGSNPGSTKVDIEFDIDENKDAVAVSNTIQERVQRAIEEFFGEAIKGVNVKANPYDANENSQVAATSRPRVK